MEEVGFGGGSSGVRMREKWGCRNRASENVSQRHLFLFESEMRDEDGLECSCVCVWSVE